ncbi:uncharacterized protein EAF01_004518 [Botrytis porri]|uniref:uncharacterized protein n=1 Tax=Botrytis porri TaxID=87229 RepID=UPI0018FFCBED|nr:uncharacterized protein EAF01_004518 [Botrytis porri]KAF7908763.1 hypothetical protein EAF01_004518 [Botrytis porri]
MLRSTIVGQHSHVVFIVLFGRELMFLPSALSLSGTPLQARRSRPSTRAVSMFPICQESKQHGSVIVITGANRGLHFFKQIYNNFSNLTIATGLGRGFLKALAQRAKAAIIAGVRDLSSTSSKSLSDLPIPNGSRIIPLEISSTDDLSPSQAVKELTNTHGITSIDVVIANAGILQYYGKVSETPPSKVRNHLEVNTIGVLTLYQATLPLLLISPDPVFVALLTAVASIGVMGDIPIPATPYGMSKVALNYMVRKIHFENEKLTAFVSTTG